MDSRQQLQKKSKIRAEKVLVGCIILTGIELGTMCVLSNYIGDICVQMNADLTQVTLMFSIFNATSAITGLFITSIIDRVPIKNIMLFGCCCYIAFFLFLYFGTSLTMLYVGSVFFGISSICVGFAVAQPLITCWHAKGVGKKISALSVAMSLFAMLLSPTVAAMLSSIGYKATVLINGVLFGAIMIMCVLFLISNKPESYGLSRYGIECAQSAEREYVPSGLTLKQAAKTPPFWAVLFIPALLMIPANGFVSNQAIVFQSYGFDPMASGAMISLYKGCVMIWVFLYGSISDKMGPKRATIVYLAGGALAYAATFMLSGFAGGVVAAISLGIVGSFSGVMGAVLLSNLFGTRSIATMIALGNVTMGIGSMLGPIVASSINQMTGSFSLFMLVGSIICCVSLILFISAMSRTIIDRIKTIEMQND